MNAEKEREKFLERAVRITPSIGARLVIEEGIYSRAPSKKEENRFVASLDGEQRRTLMSILQHERRSAIFDMLVQFHEAVVIDGWSLQKEGVPIPADRDDYTLFQDYLTKLTDEEEA